MAENRGWRGSLTDVTGSIDSSMLPGLVSVCVCVLGVGVGAKIDT